jgi:Ca2+-binding EF-hand superfamily protein
MALTEEDITEYKECFGILDKNQDGFLSNDEVKEILTIVQPAMDEKEIAAYMALGPITAKCDEATLRGAMVKKMTAPHTKDELMEAFKVFDAEGTGKMGVDEITPILEILGEQLISEPHRLNFLKKMLAKEGDTTIDYSVFIDWMLE